MSDFYFLLIILLALDYHRHQYVVMQVTKEMFDVHDFLNASDPNQRERRKYLGKFIGDEFI